MNLFLKNKTAIVTGGASGIGEAIVKLLADEGATPVIFDIDVAKAQALAASLRSEGKTTLVQPVDLRDEQACKNAVEKTLADFGSIDVLINNAGKNDAVKLGRPVQDFRQSLEQNLVQFYTMTNLCLEHLKRSKGAIVNIASKVAVTGQGGTSGYAAAKGGVLSLTREWAVQLLHDGIRVNAVVPAEVWTPLYKSIVGQQPDPEMLLAKIHQSIPLGNRMTTPEEIANMVVFLASERASHITGQFIFVDGGYTHLDRLLSVDGYSKHIEGKSALFDAVKQKLKKLLG
jgi:L-fucose dehydrogenase